MHGTTKNNIDKTIGIIYANLLQIKNCNTKLIQHNLTRREKMHSYSLFSFHSLKIWFIENLGCRFVITLGQFTFIIHLFLIPVISTSFYLCTAQEHRWFTIILVNTAPKYSAINKTANTVHVNFIKGATVIKWMELVNLDA